MRGSDAGEACQIREMGPEAAEELVKTRHHEQDSSWVRSEEEEALAK